LKTHNIFAVISSDEKAKLLVQALSIRGYAPRAITENIIWHTEGSASFSVICAITVDDTRTTDETRDEILDDICEKNAIQYYCMLILSNIDYASWSGSNIFLKKKVDVPYLKLIKPNHLRLV